MKKNLFERAKAIIAERKYKAEKESQNMYDSVLSNSEIKELDKKIRCLTIDIGKKEAEGKSTEKEKTELGKLNQQYQIALNKIYGNGFSIKPKYYCNKCEDCGITKDGIHCVCLKNEINKLLKEESGINKQLATFKDCDFDLFNKEAVEAIKQTYKKMEQWCDKTDNTKYKNIGIFGNTGVGKSFLTEAMVSRLIENEKVVYFSSAFNLNQKLLEYHTTFDESKNLILEPFLECDVLFIDDLGTEPILKNVTLEYLYLIINERMIGQKPIVFTTNLNLEDFRNRYGERIFSRLVNKLCSLTINFVGGDLRLRKS